MSLTLGLNTALSGLLTNQRGLDVVAQNVVNVNTVGYHRKVMNPESRVLAGRGAGVQEGSLMRMVNEGLLKDIRRNTSTFGKLQVEQDYFPRLDDLYGDVAENTSVAHRIQSLSDAFETLASDVNKPAIQWSTMQAGLDVTQQLSTMTREMQALRLQSDRDIEETVALINEQLTNIHSLNQSIVKNSAISTGTSDLEDKRDQALTKLSEYLDIEYFKRNDNSVIVYTKSGNQLIDNQPSYLSYSASTILDSSMSQAAGDFSPIAIGSDPTDIANEIQGGKLRALINIRDTIIPNMQAELDNLTVQMRDNVNRAHNRGTSIPNIAGSYTGTRTFAEQADVVASTAGVTTTTANLYLGTTTVTSADYTTLTWGTNGTKITMTAASGSWNATLSAGKTFSVVDPTNTRNSGSYTVVSNAAGVLTVEKVNPRQTISLTSPEDVALVTFDADGNERERTTLDTIMQANYSGSYSLATAGDGRALKDFEAKASYGAWSIQEVSAHMEGWLRAQGYSNASVNLDDNGKFAIDLNETSVSLAFRDQTSATAGTTAQDATIKFDANGDGQVDETVSGFSNFFGLNDFFVSNTANSIFDSKVQSATFTTTVARTLSLLDGTGEIGNEVTIPANSSLEDIADLINTYTRTNESARQSTNSFTLNTAATLTVSDGNSNLITLSLGAGALTLEQLAGQLTQGTIKAKVVQDGDYSRLVAYSTIGKELSIDISGGTLSTGKTLSEQLDMTARSRIKASVVPEGSGYRLRLIHSENREMYAASDLDPQSQSLLTDIGLKRANARAAAFIDVRSDIQTAPEKISRGAVLWNSDSSKYYISPGDNTTILEVASAMSTKIAMETSGGIFAGNYSVEEYASASMSMTARIASHSEDQYQYQTTLQQSLEFQYTSYSGVNMDEEVAKMMDFQQAYAASAKVITVLQEMLEVLTGMIR